MAMKTETETETETGAGDRRWETGDGDRDRIGRWETGDGETDRRQTEEQNQETEDRETEDRDRLVAFGLADESNRSDASGYPVEKEISIMQNSSVVHGIYLQGKRVSNAIDS